MLSDKLYKFHGGIHPATHKRLSNTNPIGDFPLSDKYIISMLQHRGSVATPIVKIGDKVLKHQILASTNKNLGCCIHSPTSGVIIDYKKHKIAHPGNIEERCLILKPDGKDEIYQKIPKIKPTESDPSKVVDYLQQMGIVGLGGAAFPTYMKISKAIENKINTLIINAAECEPYITADDILIREEAQKIIKGVVFLQRVLNAKSCIIAIEDNKPEALAKLQKALTESSYNNIQITVIPTVYPSGGEKQLIKILSNIEIPAGKIPSDIGFACQNISTVYAVYQAVYNGIPLVERVVTLSGDKLKKPQNLKVKIGTPIKELIKYTGGLLKNKTIMGGPMMGFEVLDTQAPTTKATNCILSQEKTKPKQVISCIRCARCQDVCPMELIPQQLYWASRDKSLKLLEKYNLLSCIECACCDYVCPSNIPLVSYFKFGKGIWQENIISTQKSTLAKRRNEARTARLEAAKQKRAAMLAQKKARLAKKGTDKTILDAMARVQKKKTLQGAKK
jgi:Na+-translocating ferredoxin:NAD+ oxidoreductase subunit C